MTIDKNNQKLLRDLKNISGKALTLGNLLWSIRKGEELTQQEFSDILNVSKQYI